MREDGQRTCFTLGKTPGAQRILLWDDLEGLFKWTAVTGYGTPRRAKSSIEVFDGSWGLQVLYRRMAPNGMLQIGAGRSFPMVRDGILRAEAMMLQPSVSGLDGFGIAVEWYDGARRYRTLVRYESITGSLMYRKGTCSLGDTGLPLMFRAKDAWHRVWMEIDLVRKEYVNVGIDADTVQLDGNKICSTADAGPVVAYVILFIVSWVAGIGSGYFDDVLVRTV